MPLIQGKSKKAFQSNVKTEMDAHPGKANRARNLAIAYNVQKKNKKARGGEITANEEDMTDVDKARDERDLEMYAQGGTVEAKDERRPDADDQEHEMAMAKHHDMHSQDLDAKSEMRPNEDSRQDREMDMLKGAKTMDGQESSMRDDKMDGIDDAHDSREMAMLSRHKGMPSMDAGEREVMMAAKGGMAGALRNAKSVAEAIRIKHKYANGGEVDLSENADESPNVEDQLSYNALRKENYSESPALEELDYDTDKSIGHDLPDEDSHGMDMIDQIRRRMKSKKM